MKRRRSLDDLHDATLVSLSLRWSDGDVEFRFRTTVHGEVRLLVRNIVDVSVPRVFAWGRTESVLSVSSLKEGGIQIQMQSGDIIVARGDDATVDGELITLDGTLPTTSNKS
jgi:hypothetical protein